MKETPVANFGLLIAYVLPGFIALCGFSLFSPTVLTWLRGGVPDSCPTVAGFLYVTLASIGIGMTVNALRWITLDSLHHRTGVPYPTWDFSQLQGNLGGYDKLVDFYYRYHEFFGNSLIAGSFTYIAWRCFHPSWWLIGIDLIYVATAALFWYASRDTLRKYYRRVEQILPTSSVKDKNPS